MFRHAQQSRLPDVAVEIHVVDDEPGEALVPSEVSVTRKEQSEEPDEHLIERVIGRAVREELLLKFGRSVFVPCSHGGIPGSARNFFTASK